MTRKILALAALIAAILSGCNLNKPPVIDVIYDSSTVYSDIEEFTVDYSVSDPEGDVVNCTAYFGDGKEETVYNCSSGTFTHIYSNSGSFDFKIIATDSKGATSQKAITVNILDGSQTCYAAVANAQSLQFNGTLPLGVSIASDAMYVPGEIIVLPTTTGMEAALKQQDFKTQFGDISAKSTIAPPVGVAGPTWVIFNVEPGQEMQAAKYLIQHGMAKYAQPNYIYKPLLGTPNDTYYSSNQKSQFDLVGAEAAWAEVLNGTLELNVGVIDSGIAYDHVDLADNIDLLGYDFSSEEGSDGYPTDNSGPHGTMVGSIIGAVTNNGEGVAGITYNTANLIPYKVFPGGTSADIADAIHQSIADGANLINLSLCIIDSSGACANLYDNPDQTIEAALQEAYNNGVVAVAAAGNYSDDWVGYPASSPYTIAVGSVDVNGNRSDFSNYGARLDLMAPGEDMAAATYPVTNNGNPAYASGDGTSFSAPVVTGAAALYMRQYKITTGTLPTPTQVAKCLCATAEDRGATGSDTQYGAGIIRIDRALDATNPICYP